MEIIRMPHGKISELARDFKLSLPTVRKALRGESNTATAKMVRKAALERGGILMTPASGQKELA